MEDETPTARTIRLIRDDERERCAKIAEMWKSPLRPGTEARRLGHEEAAREIASAIRTRGQSVAPEEK